MLAFIIWSIIGLFFIALGIYSFKAKKAVGFWANAETLPMENVKAYNKAMGKLWCVFAAILILLGTPLLAGQNSALVIFSILGIVLEMIGTMIVYTYIEEKYRVKGKK